MGLIDGQYVVNPTLEQQSKSQLDLIMAGTADAILMIEGFSNFLTDEQMLKVCTIQKLMSPILLLLDLSSARGWHPLAIDTLCRCLTGMWILRIGPQIVVQGW